MDLLIFVLPMMNFFKIRNFLSKYLPISKVEINPNLCAYCKSNFTLASKANCPHKFCYFCISSNLKADNNYLCPLCKTMLKQENIQLI